MAAQIRKACSRNSRHFSDAQSAAGSANQHRRDGQPVGRYSYVISGIDPEEVYDAADKLQAKLREYPGFASPPRSDLFRATPNLDIQIDRDRAGVYGVSTTKLQSLLRAAYSQNYVYLIKEPDDQYQVILEAEDNARTSPQDFRADLRQIRQRQHDDPDSRRHESAGERSVCNQSIT